MRAHVYSPYRTIQDHHTSTESLFSPVQPHIGKLPSKGRTWCQKMVFNWDLDNLSGEWNSTGEWRYCSCTYLHWILPLARSNSTLPCAHWILFKPAYQGHLHRNNFIVAAVNTFLVSVSSSASWKIQSNCIWACFDKNNQFIYMMSNIL